MNMVVKDPKPPKERSRGKIIFAGVIFALALAGLWARAYHVQIVKGPEYAKMANRQYWASETVSGKRGEIFDRNGLLLATTVSTQSVYVRPHEIQDKAKVTQELSSILGVNRKNVSSLVGSAKRFVWIARKVSDAQATAVREAMLPGVYLDVENARQYPQAHMAGQLLGFVNIDGQGIEGIEKSFNSILQPSSTKYTVQKDAAGKRLSLPGKDDQEIYDGQDIFLTIDSQVQLATEQALERSVVNAKGKYGIGLVVEVPTGQILGWANYPFFNPNSSKKNSNGWKNRLAVDIFEPGSTMKPIMVAAALQEKICTPTTKYYCENGRWAVGGRRIRDTHKYENLTVSEIIRYSSNIGSAKIGLALGASKYSHYLQEIGFARPLGLPLPGESAGLLRPPGQWKELDLANISFGQGLAVTMPQMAEAYLCIANGGIRIPLTLQYEPGNPVQGKRVFDTEVAAMVMAMLEEVVEQDGTGKRSRIDGIRVAGKTGTAQKASPTGGYGSDYTASFIAIFPADNPRYLICMMIDEPQAGHYGGVLVAPEVRNVGMQLLMAAGMLTEPEEAEVAIESTPTDRVVAVVRKSKAIIVHEGMVPDLTGVTVRQALETLVPQGVVPTVSGQGVFIGKQKPLPGEKWSAEKKCQLWLTDQPG